MAKTLVLQSYKQPVKIEWLQQCLASVQHWAEINQFEYYFMGDELFDYVSSMVLEKTSAQRIIATDLARIKALQNYLSEGYETVVWCDADFLIFAPEEFILPDERYALGREVWIQNSSKHAKKLDANIKVHNAFMMYKKGNLFLDLYVDTAERLLENIQGTMPPQFIGPKLLTAIHNVIQCPVQETAGMLSPLVINDLAHGGGRALELFQKKSSQPIYAANLCNSLFERDEYSTDCIKRCITVLKADKQINV